MMERRDPSTHSTDELPRTYPTDELLRIAAAHRIRLTQRLNILKRELRQRAAELAAIEACLDEVIETEHRLIERAAT
jgi:hypothetical protein